MVIPSRFTTLSLCLLAIMLMAAPGSGQTIFTEDFSTATGTTPPVGWTTVNNGGTGVWRFDNPGARAINAPLISPIAICDSDNAGSGTTTNATLMSPTFDASTQAQIILEWDHWMRSLAATTITTEVFDGFVWNVVQTVAGMDVATEASPMHESFDITAMTGGAVNAQVRYTYTSGWDWYWLIDNIQTYEPPTDDLRLVSIDAPVINADNCLNALSTSETVSVTIESNGTTSILPGTAINVDLYINGALAANDFLFTSTILNKGDTVPFTFLGTFDLSGAANTMTVKTTLFGDQDLSNNDLMVDLHQRVETVGYSQNFDALVPNPATGTPTNFSVPPGWSNDPADGASLANTIPDWAPQSSSTGSGPAADHTQGAGGSGNYMFIEDSFNETGDINLITPCFATITAPNQPAMSFWHFSNVQAGSAEDNILAIDIVNESSGGLVTMSVASFMGNGIGSDWSRKFVDLSAFGGDVVRMVFRTNNDNLSANDDVAIDDVTYFNQLPTLGQAPTPGLAVLDMNGAVNVNSDPIVFGLNGPYFSTVTSGDTLVISMSGEANQPVVMFSGPLNPRVAEFPGIGFIDVGGPLMPNGLPSALALVGDGTAPGLFNSLFVLSPTGSTELGFSVPNMPPAVIGAFQCAIFNSASPGLTFSNCVELAIQ